MLSLLLAGESIELEWQGSASRHHLMAKWYAVLLASFAVVAGVFSWLLRAAQLSGAPTAEFLALAGLAAAIATVAGPRFFVTPQRLILTERRLILVQGTRTRSMERSQITGIRIHWRENFAVLGDVDILVGVPFGPLNRLQTLRVHGIRSPDGLIAALRQKSPLVGMGDAELPIRERLMEGELEEWSERPSGFLFGLREATISVIGAATMALGFWYAYTNLGIIVELEELGLSTRSSTWALLTSAIVISAAMILTVGSVVFWNGALRSHLRGKESEYLLTSDRLIVRRHYVELSVFREFIVEIGVRPATKHRSHVFLLLDTPKARTLGVSSFLAWLPARDAVAPVLFDVLDADAWRSALVCDAKR